MFLPSLQRPHPKVECFWESKLLFFPPPVHFCDPLSAFRLTVITFQLTLFLIVAFYHTPLSAFNSRMLEPENSSLDLIVWKAKRLNLYLLAFVFQIHRLLQV